MRKNPLSKKILASVMALVMVFGVFTAIPGLFNAKAVAAADTGEIIYGSDEAKVVLNKDAWLNEDGTYNIDLIAYLTGKVDLAATEVPVPTDFVLVVDESNSMKDVWICSPSWCVTCTNQNQFVDNSGKLSAVKSASEALVDALRELSTDQYYHRVSIVGFGGTEKVNGRSATGLFDKNGTWHDYVDGVQGYYGSSLTSVKSDQGYDALKRSINNICADGGTSTHKGLEMAKGILNATKSDSYQLPDGTTKLRQKIVIVFSDGTPGQWGFQMDWAAEAMNIATSIKADLNTKIYSVSLMSLTNEEHITSYEGNGPAAYGLEPKSLPVNRYAYDPTMGYPTTTAESYRDLYLDGEFLSRDFNILISSAYPCTGTGANGRIVAKFESLGADNRGPVHRMNGTYMGVWNRKDQHISYYYQDTDGSLKLTAGQYDYRVRNYAKNKHPYNNHPVEKIKDPEAAKFYYKIDNAFDYVGYNPSVPNTNLQNLIRVFTEIAETFYSETITISVPATDAKFVKDIISDNFEIPSDFTPANNVKVFTQNATGFANGEYSFGELQAVSNPGTILNREKKEIIVPFDFIGNACLNNNGIKGKRLVVRISGLLAKSDVTGEVPTNKDKSGLYANPNDENPSLFNGRLISLGGTGFGNINGSSVTSVSLSGLTVAKGSTKRPVLNVNPADADFTVSWSSSNPSIATVDSNGNVTGVREGEAVITATVLDKIANKTYTATATIIVPSSGNSNGSAPITSVELSDMIVPIGSTKLPILKINPQNSDYSATWSIDDPSIATVDSNGIVKGVKEGITTLNAIVFDKASNTTFNVHATVIVPAGSDATPSTPVTYIEITRMYVPVGDSKMAILRVTPDNADYTVTWSTDNPSIATVDSTGRVTGVAPGTTKLRYSLTDKVLGRVTSSATDVTVLQNSTYNLYPVIGAVLEDVTVAAGKTKPSVLDVDPSNTSYTTTYRSGNTSIATVDNNGIVKGITPGVTTLTAEIKDKLNNNTKTVTSKITVIGGAEVIAPVSSAKLDDMMVIAGNSKLANLTVNPANCDYTVISWMVGDSSVATVDSNGKVTGIIPGRSTILTAVVKDKRNNSTHPVTSTVTVIGNGGSGNVSPVISVNLADMIVVAGSNKLAKMHVAPDNSDYTITSWKIDDTSIATVDGNGRVTGIIPGRSTGLTVTINDKTTGKSHSAKSTVTVIGGTMDIGGGDDGVPIVFPMPYVNIREKEIVYDFSLVIKDDSAEEFFEETRPDGVNVHDVAHVRTLDDPYAKQSKSGSSFNYHGKYPYDTNKHASLMDHFEVNISEFGANGAHNHQDGKCNASVTIKSINGERFDLAAMLELTKAFMRKDIVTGEMCTKFEWCRLSFLPATNVHYEESLLRFNSTSGSNGAGQWTEIGRANGATYDVMAGRLLTDTKHSDAQQNATFNKAKDNYGHDAEYHNGFEVGKERLTHQDSNNRAMSVKVDRAMYDMVVAGQASWPSVEFTFKGTGIDFISRTGADTGLFTMDIVPVGEDWNYSVSNNSKHVIVDTYYGDGLLYQIPVCHVDNLRWGEYKVRVKASYSPTYDHQSRNFDPVRTGFAVNEPGFEPGVVYEVVEACKSENVSVETRSFGTFNCIVDSIRVYNPHVDKLNPVTDSDHIYFKHGEQNPEFSQIRKRLISASNFGGDQDRVSGIVYIDGSIGEEITIEDYIKYGPKHEAYLKPGNGFAFTVKNFDKATMALHISAKCPGGESVAMLVNGRKIQANGRDVVVNSATEMFFDVTDNISNNGRVVISCEAISNPDATLSLCQIKLVAEATRGITSDMLYVDRATVSEAAEIIGESAIIIDNPISQLAAPANVKVSLANKKPVITWNAVSGADCYKIFRKADNGEYVLAGVVCNTSFTDNSSLLAPLTRYWYKVRAEGADGTPGSFGNEVFVTSYGLGAPRTASVKLVDRKPVITWSSVANATKYNVFRSTSSTGTYSMIATVNGLSYTDSSNINPLTKYYYKVQACDGDGFVGVFSKAAYVTSYGIKVPAPKAAITERKPVITWAAVANATKYEVFRAATSTDEFVLIGTVSGTSFTDNSSLTPLTKYYYKVKAKDDHGFESAMSKAKYVTSYGIKVPAPKAAITERKPVITWAAVANATKYEVFRAATSTGEYVLIGTVSGTSFTDNSNLTPLTKYYYKVKAKDDHGFESAMSKAKYVTSYGIKAPAPKATVTDGKPVITWTALVNATKYKVFRRQGTSGEFSLVKTVNSVSFTDTDQLNPGSKYYYKVVAADDFGFESVFSRAVYSVIPR